MARSLPLVRNGSIRRQKVAGEPVAGSSLDVGHSPERFLSRPFEPPSVSTQLCRFAALMRASTSNAALLPPRSPSLLPLPHSSRPGPPELPTYVIRPDEDTSCQYRARRAPHTGICGVCFGFFFFSSSPSLSPSNHLDFHLVCFRLDSPLRRKAAARYPDTAFRCSNARCRPHASCRVTLQMMTANYIR